MKDRWRHLKINKKPRVKPSAQSMINDKSSTMSDYLDTNPTQNVRSAFDVITGSSGGRRRHQVDVHPGRERVLGPGRQPFDSCRSSAVCGRRRLSASFFFF